MPESAFEYAPGEPLFRINAVRKSCEFRVSKFTAENLFDPVMNPGGCGGMAGRRGGYSAAMRAEISASRASVSGRGRAEVEQRMTRA